VLGGAAGAASAPGERATGGGRVVLREWRSSDIPALVAAIDTLAGREWLPFLPNPYTAEDAAEHIARTRVRLTAGTAAELAIVVDGSLAGSVSLGVLVSDPGAGAGEVGYWVAAGARGRGVATTAARLVSDFGFETLGLRRIQLNAAVANTASRRVAEKAGFELEGIRRALLLIGGVPTDHALYSRIADQA
jgi:RimJ/RimL family protein N-acetyltransferase